jgi:uncharacterized protein YkwD
MRILLFLLALVFVSGCQKPPPPPLVRTIPVQEVIDLVNQERTKAGVPALQIHPGLMKEAERYATRMAKANTLSHDLDGSLMKRLDALSTYNPYTAGENIAYGYTSATEVMVGWMSSTGHKANILNPAFKDTGVGIIPDSKGQLYYCQIFAAQK